MLVLIANGINKKYLCKSRVLSFSLLFLSILTVGCSSTPSKTTSSEADPLKEYTLEKERLEKSSVISPGFKLRILHSADDQISGEFRVDFKGYLSLPFRVKVRAAGMTTAQLEENLAQAYSRYFKLKNNVTVEITSREYLVEVRGLVQKPGQYAIKLDTSVEELIAQAGGLPGSSQEASKSNNAGKPEYVRIVRPDFMNPNGKSIVRWIRLTDYFLKYDVSNEVLWRGGEQLFFQVTGDPEAFKQTRSQTVQIMGEVHKPGEYPIQPGMDLLSYIAQAGGPTSTADLSGVTVIHKENNGSDTYNLGKSSETVDLGAGDVILIKTTQTKPGFFERLGPVFISLGSLAVSVVVIILAL